MEEEEEEEGGGGGLHRPLSHRILSMRDTKFPSEADRIPREEFRASLARAGELD